MVETSLPHTTPPFVTPVKSVAVISNPVPFVVAFAAVASTVSSTTGASVASSENVLFYQKSTCPLPKGEL